MDINQNQQTNTFVKGMNTDTSDMYLSSELYRYAENVRPVTNKDNNSGELHLIEGTVLSEHTNKEILATNYIRDIAVYIMKDPDSSHIVDEGLETEHTEYTHGSWYVFKKVGDEPLERVFGPCTELLWETEDEELDIEKIKKSITTVLRYEAPLNIKLYIADSTGKHSIMVLNIAKTYGDGSNESKFDDVFAYLRTLLPPPEILIGGSGSIPSGRVLYAYRLYQKNGASTPLSILSKIINLYKNEHEGYEAEKKSGRSVTITIPNINKNLLTEILVYRISYQLSGQLPKISLIKDSNITENILDNGVNIIEDVSISDFLSMFTPFIYSTQIESKGDYLFSANIKYTLDLIDEQFSWFDAKSYSKGNYTNLYSSVVENDLTIHDIDLSDLHHKAFEYENAPEYIDSHWEKYDGIYNGYGKYICWYYIHDEIPNITSENQGDISYQKSTFKCGETYRFGIKLYNKYGQSSSVKWIADIMIPTYENIYYDNNIGYSYQNVGIKFIKNPISDWKDICGWEIVRCERKLLDRKSITQGIIGFPLHQYLVENGNYTDTGLICNPGILSKDPIYIRWTDNQRNEIGSIAKTDDDFLLIASPEFCYLQDDIEDLLKSNQSQLYITELYSWRSNYELTLYNNWYRLKQTYNQDMSIGFKVSTYNDNSFGYYLYDNFGNINGNIEGVDDDEQTIGKSVYNSDGSTTVYFLNHFTQEKYSFNQVPHPDIKYNVDSISFSNSPKSEDFSKNETLTFKNNVTTIDNCQFINWSAPLLLNVNGDLESDVKHMMNNISEDNQYINDTNYISRLIYSYPIGSGGNLILIKQNSNNKIGKFTTASFTPRISVVNVNKNTTPYGGYNEESINNSEYLSFGDFLKFDNNDNDTKYINVFSGDTKIKVFTYNASHNWYDSTYKNCHKMANIYTIPIETDIDILAQYGQLYGVDGFVDYRLLDISGAVDTFTQDKNAYMYNTAYNATPDIITWTTPEQSDNKIDRFDTRIHYSNPKINNEDIDNWVLFQPSNYIDVDSRYGEITDLKLFKDKLIFWLENATGLLAVNERVVLNDQNDTQVVLGTGGVLERYDYFTTVYGLKKNQHARTTSNDSLYWWDENNREILLYLQKYDITPLSTVKNIKNYINDNPVSSIPFLTYDNKYKEIIANVVNKGSIVYNEQIQAFSSVYTFSPIFEAIVDSNLYLTDKNVIYKYNKHSGNTSKLFTENTTPTIKYVINELSMYNKTFDILTFGGRLYGGGFDEDRSIPYTGTEILSIGDRHARNNDSLKHLSFTYKTPLKQESRANGKDVITNTEYDFRLTVPRAGYETVTIENEGQPNESRTYKWNVNEYGDRMRGKTMQCELKSDSNDLDFSLQYVTTKFRMSWN